MERMGFDANNYLHILAQEMQLKGDVSNAKAQSKYLKNLFPFFGLKSADRRAIVKSFTKANGKVPLHELETVLKKAYQYKEREMHYFAMELLVKHKKQLTASHLLLAKWMITHNSWWDTVDLLAAHVIGILSLKFNEVCDEVDTWIKHENMWLRRTAILYQLGYKEKTDAGKLFAFCAERAHEKEFFIRKAIGWALREYAKTNPKEVLKFVENHEELSGLSKREALKHLV